MQLRRAPTLNASKAQLRLPQQQNRWIVLSLTFDDVATPTTRTAEGGGGMVSVGLLLLLHGSRLRRRKPTFQLP